MLSHEPFECPAHLLTLAARGEPVVMAIAGAESEVVLESARRAWELGLILPLLIGELRSMEAAAEKIAWDLSALKKISSTSEEQSAQLAVALARSGEARAVMKGQIHTDCLMAAALRRHEGLRAEGRLSHLFYVTIPGRPGALSVTDAALNVAPSPMQRVEILSNAIGFHHRLAQDCPKAAVLSATESPIASMPSSEEAAEIVMMAQKTNIGAALIEGPMALDLAISPKAAALKGIVGPVFGEADILLVPNIETGNTLTKAMVHFMSATAAGIVLGASAPIVLTSRADPPEARLAASALAKIAASKGNF